MAKKKKRIDKRKKAAKASFSKMDKKLLDASEAILTVSIETGKKWHKFIKKTVTTVEPIREKQIDMFFDTTDSVVTQVEEQADKFKSRLGIQEDIGEIVKQQLDRKKIVNLLKSNASKLVSIASPNGIKETIEAGAVKLKMEVEDRLSGKKSKSKKKKKKKDSKKKGAKAKKAKAAKAKTKTTTAKAAPKRATSKRTSASTTSKTRKPAAKKPVRKAVVRKAPAKARATRTTRATKANATTKRAASKKDDLTLIHGIGPKMSGILSKKGITTFAALSKMPKTSLQKIIDESGFSYKSYKANQWTQQATFASKSEFSKMTAWVDKNMK